MAEAGIAAAGEIDAGKVIVGAGIDAGEAEFGGEILIEAGAIDCAQETGVTELDVIDDGGGEDQIVR